MKDDKKVIYTAKKIEEMKAELDDLINELTEGEGGAGAIDYFNVVSTEDIFTGE